VQHEPYHVALPAVGAATTILRQAHEVVAVDVAWPGRPPWRLPLALCRGLEYGKGQEETAALAGRTLDPGLATVGLGYAADD